MSSSSNTVNGRARILSPSLRRASKPPSPRFVASSKQPGSASFSNGHPPYSDHFTKLPVKETSSLSPRLNVINTFPDFTGFGEFPDCAELASSVYRRSYDEAAASGSIFAQEGENSSGFPAFLPADTGNAVDYKVKAGQRRTSLGATKDVENLHYASVRGSVRGSQVVTTRQRNYLNRPRVDGVCDTRGRGSNDGMNFSKDALQNSKDSIDKGKPLDTVINNF